MSEQRVVDDRHYRGIAEVYDKIDKGVVVTKYTITDAVRTKTSFALDLEAEDGTRTTFSLRSQDGVWFTGHNEDATVKIAVWFEDEEEEEGHLAGSWDTEHEKTAWLAEFSQVAS